MARKLGARLQLPVVDKDQLREGALLTLGSDNLDEAPRGVELFYATMESLLAHQDQRDRGHDLVSGGE